MLTPKVPFYFADYRCDSVMASVYGQNLHQSSKSGGPLDILKNAISTIFDIWFENYADQFNQPPEFVCLKQLVEYVHLHMPGSDLEHCVYLLVTQLEDQETMRAMSEVPTGEQESAQAAASNPEADPQPMLA
ncbi:ral guanine nucleotide dissociation stimulator-like isoform X3 [Octodon degus]|uniref:Ral guanine nucleotide dissociation stimulator-like isoform X3 n=1 Tax=Octodon degus TaxID=10160 RepID=A0A6P6DHL7_OCTDE|nr:ral guanine nucleotide dissociation stimulator-like isoform X3 [Octodon degus]